MTTKSKVILGLAGAAAAGVLVGLLLAPEKGTDLQAKIKDGAQDWINQLSSLLNTGRDVAAEIKSKTQQGVEGIKAELNEVH